MKKLRILPLHGATNKLGGGIYRYCRNLQTLFDNNPEIEILDTPNPQSIYIKRLNKRWFKWRKLYGAVKSSDCDMVIINGFANPSIFQQFIVARLLHKKIIYAPHFHPFETLEKPTLAKLFFFGLIRPLLGKVDGVLTIGKRDYEFFRNYNKNVKMIPHHFYFSEDEYATIERKSNMILFVGRNVKNKGIEYLYSLPPEYEVHCVTEGELQRKDFVKHERISQKELDLLYSTASLVVIPSRYEAFSYVALESFSHGTPVVMSDKVKIIDHLEGEAGYGVFKYGDVKEFVAKVKEIIGSKFDKKLILRHFDPEYIREEYYGFFKSIIG